MKINFKRVHIIIHIKHKGVEMGGGTGSNYPQVPQDFQNMKFGKSRKDEEQKIFHKINQYSFYFLLKSTRQ